LPSNVDPLPTYTSQDFSAVNDYIGHLADRHQARTSRWRSETFGAYLKWIAILIAAGGFVVFLILFGLSLLKDKPEPQIVRPVVVDRQVTIHLPEGMKNQSQGPAIETRQEVTRRIDEFKTRKIDAGAEQPQIKSVFNYVIFKEMIFNRAGIRNVVVGMEYKDPTNQKPSKQWCYVSKPNTNGTSTRVGLADKTDSTQIDRTLTLAKARDMRATLSDLKAAQRLCRFE
jgi:hypothetical protein